MPEHTSFFHYLLSSFPDAFKQNAKNFGTTFLSGNPLGYKDFEPVFAAAFIMLFIVYLAAELRSTYRDLKASAVPEDKLTLRTFFEVFFEYFYDLAKGVMGPKNAKRYFPLIGSSAIFIFVANAIGLVPGFNPPTSSWNVTIGCALLVFVLFNYYGIRENGWGYLKHLAGPTPALAPLLFPIEVISLLVRPVTLSIRLMLNLTVDHLLVSILMGMYALFLPIPIFFLGLIVIVVQTLVFCLLTSIYIGLATEHQEAHH